MMKDSPAIDAATGSAAAAISRPLTARLFRVRPQRPGSSQASASVGRNEGGTAPSDRRRRWRPVSPLTLRILAINVLALVLLLAGLLYLGQYQDRLVQAELETLSTEARIFASALGEGALEPSTDEFNEPSATLSTELARQMIRRLVETTGTRTRLFSPAGQIIADSRVVGGQKKQVEIEALPPLRDGSRLTELGIALYDMVVNTLPGREHLPSYPEGRIRNADALPDVRRALTGEVVRSVWRVDRGEGRQEMLLTVAVPVQRYKQVLGSVYISRSGAAIDQLVRQQRIDTLKQFGGVLLITVLLSLYLAGTIARPIRKLARAADAVRHGHGRQASIPDFPGRHDEVGDLAVSLKAMTTALWDRMDAIERFAADVAHEIKNPLTSMRSAVETVQRARTEEQRQRLLAIIHHDVQRLDRLISDISNASRLDAELSRAESEPVDIGWLLSMLCDAAMVCWEEPEDGEPAAPRVVVELPAGAGPSGGSLTVPGLPGRLTQVVQNLLSNALSFSPAGGTVTLRARGLADQVVITVEDEGPGIPEGKLDAIFDRFYSERPKSEAFGSHSGLGLSISKQIVDAHHGRIVASNRRDRQGNVIGALFTVELPR
jgi:two-component system, OmpR family, sensor histidine kinase ChvG